MRNTEFHSVLPWVTFIWVTSFITTFCLFLILHSCRWFSNVSPLWWHGSLPAKFPVDLLSVEKQFSLCSVFLFSDSFVTQLFFLFASWPNHCVSDPSETFLILRTFSPFCSLWITCHFPLCLISWSCVLAPWDNAMFEITERSLVQSAAVCVGSAFSCAGKQQVFVKRGWWMDQFTSKMLVLLCQLKSSAPFFKSLSFSVFNNSNSSGW